MKRLPLSISKLAGIAAVFVASQAQAMVPCMFNKDNYCAYVEDPPFDASTKVVSPRSELTTTVQQVNWLVEQLVMKFSREFSQIEVKSVSFHLEDGNRFEIAATAEEVVRINIPIVKIKLQFEAKGGWICQADGQVKKDFLGTLYIGDYAGFCF